MKGSPVADNAMLWIIIFCAGGCSYYEKNVVSSDPSTAKNSLLSFSEGGTSA